VPFPGNCRGWPAPPKPGFIPEGVGLWGGRCSAAPQTHTV